MSRHQMGVIALVLAAGLCSAAAQTTITYSDGGIDINAYDTSAPNDPTNLSITSGNATQSGLLFGTGEIVKLGAGGLSLTAANSYSGGTMVTGGTLLVGDNDALGTGNVTLANGTTFGVTPGSLILLNNDLSVAGDISLVADGTGGGGLEVYGTVSLGAEIRTVMFADLSSYVCFEGEISGAGGLNLQAVSGGTAAIDMCGTASNTYSGLTTVGNGVQLSLSKYDPGVPVTAIAGDLTIDAGGVVTLLDSSNQINPASTVTVNGILGFFAISDTVTQQIATLQGTGAIENILGPAVLDVSAGNFSGTILDGGAAPLTLIKSGAGTLILSGASGFVGGTTINAGRLQTTDPSALGGSTGPVTLVGGTLALVGQLDVASLTWTGGSVALAPAVGDVLNVTSAFTNSGAGGTFQIDPQGLVPGTFTLVTFGTTNFTLGQFSLVSNNPNVQYTGSFILNANSLQFGLTGASATGAILQNSNPVGIPTFADFTVNGPVVTGGSGESNTIQSLTFQPGSSLQVFNNLTNTGGNFTVNGGTASMNGPGTTSTPGLFTKLGQGLLNLLLNVFVSGNANVAAGGLAVNGQFTANNLFVQNGAYLQGGGQINANVFNSGVVAPGNSPGTLTINGNYTQSNTGALQIELADAGLFDRLVVTGNAALAGELQVASFGGYTPAYGEQFAFLQAGSISGGFDTVTTWAPSTHRARFLQDGGTGTILIAPASYTLVAQTQNQKNVAGALDRFIQATTGDRQTVSIALDKQSSAQYPAAFNAISPAFYESLADITIEQAFTQGQLLNQRFGSLRLGVAGFQCLGIPQEPLAYDKDGKSVADPKNPIIEETKNPSWSTWAQGNGIFARITNVSQVPNYRFASGGVLLGADYRWNEHFVTGLYGGYQGTYAKYNSGSSTRINSALFGGYAAYTNGGFYADAVAGGGYSNYNARRAIKFSTVNRTARSQADGGQFNAGVNFGYDWKVKGLTFGPILGAQYTFAGIAPFSETGAGSVDLRLAQQNVNSLRTTIGGRVAYTWNATKNIVIIPEGRMFWQHEFLDGSRTIGASLDGGNGPGFDYATSAPARDGVFAGAGVSAQFGERWSSSLFYNADFGRQDFLSHIVSASLGVSF